MIAQNLQIENSETIEILVNDGTVKEFSFPQNLSTIENGEVVAIGAYSVANITTAPSGKAVVNATAFNEAYLVLRKKASGRDDINKFPLQDLNRANNQGVMTQFEPMQIDFSQSKIVVGNNTPLVVGEVFMLVVVYDRLGKNQKK